MARNVLSRLSSIDWDFAGSMSESPFSAIHFHPCRFASQVPATLIGVLSKQGDLVLDPFSGSGTTLVEAQRLGRRAIGIELNPIAALVGRAKTLEIPACEVTALIQDLKAEAASQLGNGRDMFRRQVGPKMPPTVQFEKWYSKRVAADLGTLWGAMELMKGTSLIIARTAFSGILLDVCRETRHWGYVCDNTRPNGERDADVLSHYSGLLDRLDRAYRDRDEELIARGNVDVAEVKVVCEEASVALKMLHTESVDLIVTSPPYFGVCDYVKAQRLSMEWFGIETESLRLREIGARSKRHRKDAADEYVSEITCIFKEMRRCIRKGGRIALVLGESNRRVNVLNELREGINAAGLVLDLELNRTVSTQRRLAPSIMGEHLFILSRVK